MGCQQVDDAAPENVAHLTSLRVVQVETGATIALVGDGAQLPTSGAGVCSTWLRRSEGARSTWPKSTAPPTPLMQRSAVDRFAAHLGS